MQYWFNTVQNHIDSYLNASEHFEVLEIGVHKAGNTRQLLERYPKMHLTSIDPVSNEDIEKVITDYPDRFTFVQNISLNVLKDLDSFDIVLIDGDHNRYTVYNELKTIFEYYDTFPLIIFHDTHKPYGRVDFSYNRSNIPDGELHKEPQGVLSGIEQFITEHTSDKEQVWFKLTLYNLGPGLGVLERIDDKI